MSIGRGWCPESHKVPDDYAKELAAELLKEKLKTIFDIQKEKHRKESDEQRSKMDKREG